MDWPGNFLHRKVGVNQEYPLAIIANDIVILPLIHEYCAVHPQVKQPWSAEDAGAGGTLAVLQEHMWDLMVRVPHRDTSLIQPREYW